MSTLVLEIKQGELLIINGAPIRFKTRSRIELAGQARFLFGKQILSPAEANTPARRIYFALQAVYVGTDEERAAALISAHSLIEAFKAATTSVLAREILDRAMALAREGACYEALKLSRRIIRHETAVFEGSKAAVQARAIDPSNEDRGEVSAP
jgi:flagellar protein FlbT